MTPADFVEGRYDSRPLALAVAVTGILATMPYIALQLVGIQVVLEVMGIGGGSDNWFVKDLPLFLAFAVLAAYTYSSGLRAPALIAFVKDTLIYLVIIVAVIYLPHQLGGWGHIFDTAIESFTDFNADNADAIAAGRAAKATMPPSPLQWAYATLALGSALALFMYPHSITGVLSTKSRNGDPAQRGVAAGVLVPAGAARPARLRCDRGRVKVDQRPAGECPQLFAQRVPQLVRRDRVRRDRHRRARPRGHHVDRGREPVDPQRLPRLHQLRGHPAEEARQSKIVSLVVKFGALGFVLWLPNKFAINLQLLGGIWILQTLPAIVVGLFTGWFHRWALLIGWAVGMAWGTWAMYNVPAVGDPGSHFGSPVAEVPFTDTKGYIALSAVVINLLVSMILTAAFRAGGVTDGLDSTSPEDYRADAGDPGVEPLPGIDGPPSSASPVGA